MLRSSVKVDCACERLAVEKVPLCRWRSSVQFLGKALTGLHSRVQLTAYRRPRIDPDSTLSSNIRQVWISDPKYAQLLRRFYAVHQWNWQRPYHNFKSKWSYIGVANHFQNLAEKKPSRFEPANGNTTGNQAYLPHLCLVFINDSLQPNDISKASYQGVVKLSCAWNMFP